jgi:deoxyadenosine/deoxycytidine kinase
MSAQLFFLLQRYAQQGELAQGDLFSRGGVVSDYLFAKDRLFAVLNLSDDELALYDRIYQMLKPRTVTPDLVVYLQARTDVLLDRIRKRGRAEERPNLEHRRELLAVIDNARAGVSHWSRG